MRRLLYILLILACFGAKAQQTYTISGTVSNEKGTTIPGATVFITNSSYVMATDDDGKFSFGNMQPGKYEVVIKMLGFNPVIKNITVQNRSIYIDAALTESITTLNTVNITAGREISDRDRERYLAMFIKNFIGETVNSEQCILLNPQALSFHFNRNTNTLKASADEFLVVENKALGYKLKYLLTTFELNKNTNKCTTGGYPYFEELKGAVEQQKKWEINRRVAYLSSDRHFFRALIKNTLAKEGFLVYIATNDPVITNDLKLFDVMFSVRNIDNPKKSLTLIKLSDVYTTYFVNHPDDKTLIAPQKIIGRDTIGLEGIYIVYSGEKESAMFYKTGIPFKFPLKILSQNIPPNRQLSKIQPNADSVIIDRNGGLTPAKAFTYFGYWAWQRIADLTPLDYFVDQPTEEKK